MAVTSIAATLGSKRLLAHPWLLFAVLSVEAIVLFVLRLPGQMEFDSFAFHDAGENLTAQYLIAQGYRPTIDFAYHYGLLPLYIARMWFKVWGLTPLACVAAIPILDLFVVWGLVRFATGLRLNLGGFLLLLTTAPFTIPSLYLSLAHAFEPVFLCHALAEQARGNRRSALALTTASLFVKPSMAYVYGLFLLFLIVAPRVRSPTSALREIFIDVYPAALIALGITAVLGVSFGAAPLLRSLLPCAGSEVYRSQNYGFLGAGRAFWAPVPISWGYYLTSIAGPWLLGSLVLIAAALASYQSLARPVTERRDFTLEMVRTCAVLHLAFVALFFGNEFTWRYYFYVLVLGLAAASRLRSSWRRLVVGLAVAIPIVEVNHVILGHFAAPSHRTSVGVDNAATPVSSSGQDPARDYQLWYTSYPTRQTAYLWAPKDERDEWVKVLSMVRGHRTAILDLYGCADLLFPEFDPPVTLALVAGEPTSEMVARKISQLRSVSMIVMPRSHSELLTTWAAIGNVVQRDFATQWWGSFFVVYRRTPS